MRLPTAKPISKKHSTRPCHTGPLGTDFAKAPPQIPAPRVVSVGFQQPKVPIRSYFFQPALLNSRPDADVARFPNGPVRPGKQRPQQKRNRIRPPQDVIKVQDRLFYLLQPPLESWLSTDNFEFPFEPFPFQMEGIAFLYPRVAAVLADVMGLGKTMQAITTTRMLLRAGEVGSVLIVCPKPLVTNWVRELSVWAPEIPVAVIEGNQTKREFQWQSRDIPVQIANYELLVRDGHIVESPDVAFDLVILDEAQRIKNRSSTTSKVARSLTRKRSWALTGTPIENSAEDLLGIFEFVRPGLLEPTMTPRRMGKSASDLILRRTKEEVLTDLPPKLFRDANIDLTREQWAAYEMAEAKGLVRLNELGDEATIQHVFELVLRLKQICNFDPYTQASAKLDQLETDLEEVAASGQKAIVFSQWVKTLDVLQERLSRFHPQVYHGGVPSGKRDQVIERFRDSDDCHVILMSYGAGSVGLNLQFSQYVFLFDRWWNPAVEDQAINRAHRIGAAGPVTVTRFLALGTIEQRIDDVLRQKRELFDAVLSAASTDRSLGLSGKEIFGLFDLDFRPRTTTTAA